MNRRTIVALAVTVLGVAIGGAVGALLDRLTLGTAMGTLAGTALGAFTATHRRRWLAVGLLNIQILLAFVVGDVFGLAFTLIAVALTFFITSAVLAEFYGGDEIQAVVTHLRLIFGGIHGFQIVDDTTPVGAQTAKPLLGPRLLIVRPGKAVVLERGAQRRVIRPRMTTTEKFEYVKYVHHLGDVQTAYNFANVLTQDLVSSNVQMTAVYALAVRPEVRAGAEDPNDAEKDLLLRIPLAMPAWETALKQVLEQSVRQAVGQHPLERLLDGTDLDVIELAITDRARHRIAGWGVTLQQVIIQGVSASPEVAAAMEMRRKDREMTVAMKDALVILADGYTQVGIGMQRGDIRLEVLRRTLEQIVQQLSAH